MECSAEESMSAPSQVAGNPLVHPWASSGHQQVRFGIGDGPFAAEDAGEHRNALLRKGKGRVATTAALF